LYKFGRDNAKLKNLLPFLPKYLKYIGNYDSPKLFTFSKLSGHNCPYANDCLSKAIETPTGMKIQDGPNTKFRCFSASQEVLFPNVYAARKHNSDLTKGKKTEDLRTLIRQSLPDGNVFRIHVGGDFMNRFDFDAWMHTAIDNPRILFYAYTKSLPFWVKHLGSIPANFVLTASYGGLKDELIDQYKLRYANVVNSPADTKLPIDHNDSLAANPQHRKSFSLLLHGTQPKGVKRPKYGYKR
jgi:hypothetical protein